MRWGVRGKLFVGSLVLIVTSVVAANLYLASVLEAELTQRIRAELDVRLALMERQIGREIIDWTDVAACDRLADDLGQRSGTRVTLVRQGGTVVGDSEITTESLAALESHAGRPEIAAALNGVTGSETRVSATLKRRMAFVAGPVRSGATIVGAVRAGIPLTEVEDAVARIHRALGIASLLAIAVALLISSGAAQFISRGLRDIIAIARRMAEGDLTARTLTTGRDELGDLGRTLDQLADNLSTSLRDLRAERDRLGRILEGMNEGVLVIDADRAVVLLNPALRTMLQAEPPRTGPATDVMPAPAIALVPENLHAVLEKSLASNAPATGEIDAGPSGRRRLLVHAAPLSGKPRGCVAVLVDVTEIRRLESIRRDFVANVSHELRTPVTAVRTALETARGVAKSDPASAERFLDMAFRNAERLASLVQDLLDLSRIESGELKLDAAGVDISAVFAQVLGNFVAPAERKHLRLSHTVPADLPSVCADRRALEQVVSNLLDNAVKYAGDGGSITLRAARLGRWIRLAIEDTGPGIGPQHLPRLFERFYRVDEGRSRDRGGTGLGLAIVKHLVEAMGGAVEVESTVGKGSTFSVTLPMA